VDFWSRLDDVRTRWNVLEHPFYERWSRGELTRGELATYAGEYRHAVVALAAATARAAAAAPPELRDELAAHAGEEAAHIALWDGFARAVDGDVDRAPAPESAACAETWEGASRDLLGHLVTLYAVESAQPAISETKVAGLLGPYGFARGDATAYFELHAERDHAHAAHGRALIEPRLAEADQDALVAEAERVLEANWRLLDGVDRLAGVPARG